MADVIPWSLTVEQYERLEERARAELHELRRAPGPAGSAEFLRKLGYEISAWRLLGRADEAREAVQQLLKSWGEYLRTEESFRVAFSLWEGPLMVEEKWSRMKVLEDGVELLITAERTELLGQFRKRLGEKPHEGEREGRGDWWRWWPRLRQLLSLAIEGYLAARAERKELWERWWIADWVSEEDWTLENGEDWRAIRAIDEGDADALQALLSTWYAAQHATFTRLSESQHHDRLYPVVEVNQLLELWPATLLRLAERRSLALSLGSYPAPWILQALGAPPTSLDK